MTIFEEDINAKITELYENELPKVPEVAKDATDAYLPTAVPIEVDKYLPGATKKAINAYLPGYTLNMLANRPLIKIEYIK